MIHTILLCIQDQESNSLDRPNICRGTEEEKHGEFQKAIELNGVEGERRNLRSHFATFILTVAHGNSHQIDTM